MEVAIEILQHITTTWSRWLIFLAIILVFWSSQLYKSWKKQRDELDSMKKLQMALEIKRILLEIELIELEIKYHSSDMVRIPHIKLQEENEINPAPLSSQVRWTEKMIYGLLGSFFFLLIIVLLYLTKNIEELQSDPYKYVSFANELIITVICGTCVALISGNKPWEFFFYGFSLQVMLVLIMTELTI